MQSIVKRVQILKEASEVIRNLRVEDSKDEEMINSITHLRIGLDEFYKVFKFPHGTKLKYGRK